MTQFRVENLSNGAYFLSTAKNSKAAHEMGQTLWPGQPISVSSTSDHNLEQVFQAEVNQTLDWIEGAWAGFLSSDRVEMARCITRAQERLSSLLWHVQHNGDQQQ